MHIIKMTIYKTAMCEKRDATYNGRFPSLHRDSTLLRGRREQGLVLDQSQSLTYQDFCIKEMKAELTVTNAYKSRK